MTAEFRRNIGRYAALLAILAVALFLATDRLVVPSVVVGPSMEPTLRHGDLILVDLWSYRQRPPRAGEIVLVSVPSPDGSELLKRVVLHPAPESERPVVSRWSEDAESAGPPLWLEGDNPGSSVDSRAFGSVPSKRVKGRAFFCYWPVSRAGPIR